MAPRKYNEEITVSSISSTGKTDTHMGKNEIASTSYTKIN
jgi:hypothetical protein